MLQFEETKSVAGLGIQTVLNAGLNMAASVATEEPTAATIHLVASSAVATIQMPEGFRRTR